MSFTSFMVNRSFRKGDTIRDAGLTIPEDIRRYDNIQYGSDEKWNLLDVYSPSGNTEKLPVIISVHGGGWVYGSKEVYQWYCMNLAQRGFVVVNFSYRLAPKFKYPVPLEDTNNVFKWVLEHAEEYGMDRDRIFAVGDSAGAHMLALYTCICTNPSYAKSYSFQTPERFAPKAVGLNCGVYDIFMAINDNAMGMMKRLMKDFLGRKFNENAAKANPVSFLTNEFPPVYLMTSTGDFLLNQAPVMVEKLKELGIPYEYKIYGTKEDKLPHVFHCNIKTQDAKICNDEETSFFLKQ